MDFSKRNDWANRLFQIVASLNSLAVLFVLSVYAYGGLFSRYQADDYCESVYLLSSQNLLDATFKAYVSWLNSYSVLLFVQLIDWAGIWGFRLMAGVTILFWVLSLTWLFSEIGKALNFRLHSMTNLWFAGVAIFLSLYQAPALYQILYWRTSLIPYTLPLAFFILITAFVLWYARFPYRKPQAVWAGILCVGLVFFAGGLGETTSALQIGLLAIAVVVVWLTRKEHQRKDILSILAVSLAGAVVSILLLAFSPGTITRLNVITTRFPIYNPIELSLDVIVYTSQFLWDAFKVAPLPNLISIIAPLGILYYQLSDRQGNLPQVSSSRIRLTLVLFPVFMFIIIGCSFAPSAFVRTFPVARARFAAHFVLTLGLVLEGGLLGIFVSRIGLPVKAGLVKVVVVVFLGLLILYPLRASAKVYASLSENRAFAAAWDVRDAYIRQSVSDGARDLVVVQLEPIGGVGEYRGKTSGTIWINNCAAKFYGLDTLFAP